MDTMAMNFALRVRLVKCSYYTTFFCENTINLRQPHNP